MGRVVQVQVSDAGCHRSGESGPGPGPGGANPVMGQEELIRAPGRVA